ncbi:hypothetical protein [Adhaeribacter aquaticus]|uniref:hypothetical protein n=1 Tax=Adhaeribacter aquaticus TaxID=299567 RepID=UPI000402DC45|nr:hypothetical protein [Adhaeribacter aquaticus]
MKEYLAKVFERNGLIELAPELGFKRFMNPLSPSDYVTLKDDSLECSLLKPEPFPISDGSLKVIIAFHKLHPTKQEEVLDITENSVEGIISFMKQGHRPDTIIAIFKKDLIKLMDELIGSVKLN